MQQVSNKSGDAQTIISHLNTQELLSVSKEVKHSLWDHKLLTIEKNNITFGNLAVATLVCCIGLWYLNKLKKKFRDFLLHKFHDDKDAANAIENIASYLALIIFATMILQIANIPLSTFAFVGGALAIGVGLGAQNLINNFISSLIIMVERPVKIGDIIQIDNLTGKVITIGARCITIETDMMTNVLIPNSTVLQQNLVNWSLIDPNVKGYVTVKFYKNQMCKIGKALGRYAESYKSLSKSLHEEDEFEMSPEQIRAKLQRIFESMNHLNSISKPIVHLKGIDDFYYIYQIHFICNTTDSTDIEKIKSEINLKLAQNFQAENMTIDNSSSVF
ncbi:MAG: mechanosensitive ion channel [Rickettsiaceae bacterium]|nr:mechanosensitive ion channel [Rickettsiaceae bacterium]